MPRERPPPSVPAPLPPGAPERPAGRLGLDYGGVVLSVLTGYPCALIGADCRYRWVSDGWAEAYSPGEVPAWWVGLDHRTVFRLDDHPDWLAAWEMAQAGEPVVRADSLDLPGLGEGAIAVWMILPASDGATLIVVVDAHAVIQAVQAAAAMGA